MKTTSLTSGNQSYAYHLMGTLLMGWGLFGSSVLAQPITIDGTTNTLVNGATTCTGNCTITGTSLDVGGQNLFHSFQTFNVGAGATVTFTDPGVVNILTRVTGGNLSTIDGVLAVAGNANLFLINPQGIQFGSGSTLNINGSFIASSANSIRFENGQSFSAINPNAPPLLTVNVPLGLQVGPNPGAISANQTVLVLPPGQTLGLIGGNLNLTESVLVTSGGQVELGSVGSEGLVRLNANNAGFTATYGDISTFRDIQLSGGTIVDVSGPDAGSIQVQGRQIDLTDRSAFLAIVEGTGDGSITLRATDRIRMVGQADDPNNPVPFNTGARILIFPGGTGTTTNQITIDTNRLELSQGAQIGITMVGEGESGTVTIKAQTISVDNGSELFPSALFTSVEGPGTGQGGNLLIMTDRLQVTNGAQLVASTFALGDAGNFTLQAQEIEVSGSNVGGPSLLASDSVFSPIFGDSGRGGTLTINTNRLIVRNGGQIATSTQSVTNPAGDLIIRATESVTLQGRDEFGRSGLFANALSARDPLGNAIPARGAGGNIVVDTDRLVLSDGATINVSNNPSNPNSPFSAPGLGSAGNITVNARQIQLDNQSVITADTIDGDRGNINLQSDLILLRRNSLITTNATGTASGGNINMNTTFLVGVSTENSDITANSVNSFGGRVRITTRGIFGITPRTQLTPFSDITATSDRGPEFNGIIEINNPDTDPIKGVTELPSTLIDPATIVVAACEQGTGNQFVVTGQGGLPDDATQPLRSYGVWQDLRLSGDTVNSLRNLPSYQVSQPVSAPPTTIQAAQQLVKDDQGKIHLIALQQSEASLFVGSHQPFCQRP